MGQPNFDAFLNTPAETPKETKKKVQGDTPKFSINKNWLVIGGSLALALVTIGTTTVVTNGHKAKAQQTLEYVNSSMSEYQSSVAKVAENSNKLSERDFKHNVQILTKNLDTLKADKSKGITGYFVANGKYYTVIRYERETGQLFTVETTEAPNKDNLKTGTPVTLSDKWVASLVSRYSGDGGSATEKTGV
jgi:hypothetical protein